MEGCQTLNINISRTSTHAYLDYRKRMQHRLANLNNNVSTMIKESFSGIDDICQRVRECLYSVNLDERQKTVSFTEDPAEYEIVEERSKSGDDTLTAHDNDEATDASDEKLEREYISHTEENLNKTPNPNPYATLNSFDKGDSNTNELTEKHSEEEDEALSNLSEAECENEDKYNVLERFKETVLSNVVSTCYDDFDVMNKIIENINEEINDFSHATISGRVENDTSDHKATSKRPKFNARLKQPPPIRNPPSISTYRAKNLKMQPNTSQKTLENLLFKTNSPEPSIMPDVYRKRAFTNLYQRLMLQLEANDSLVLFQKLMSKSRHKRKHTPQKSFNNPSSKLLDVPMMNYYPKKSKSIPNSQEVSKKVELSKKYNDSLWFSHFKGKTGAKRTPPSPPPPKRKVKKPTESQKSLKRTINFNLNAKDQKRKTKCPSSGQTSKRSSKANSVSSVNSKSSSKGCPLECTCKMVVHNDKPLAPSTKCRLHWMRAKTSLAPTTRKLEFLDILDDLTNRDLLPLQSEYPRRDNQPSEQEQKDIHSTYLYQLMYGKQGTKNVWKQLLEPSIECSMKTCNICRPGTGENPDKVITNKEKVNTPKYTRNEILKKLSPYMHDPARRTDKFYQTVTVMPVHVYYDSYRTPEPPTKLNSFRTSVPGAAPSPKKLPAFKDYRGFKRAEWASTVNTKPMKVVFDSLPKKLDVPPLALQSVRTITNSARIATEKSILKSSTSKSFSPKSFAPFCRNPSPQQPKGPMHVELKEQSRFAKIQSDLEKIKSDVEGKNIVESERKLWATKYQKTVGQQLVSFVERQEPIGPPPIPKHAAPKYKGPLPDGSALSPTKDLSPQRLFSNLDGLRQKNSVIQSNIQKAIGVIEAKMVDILSADGETGSAEAFDMMEKEITGVLSMMKSKKKGPKAISSKSGTHKDGATTETSLEEEVNTISDELFKKLEKILDSERSSAHSSRSGGTDISVKCKALSKDEKRSRVKKDESKPIVKKEDNRLTQKKEEVKKPRPSSSRKNKWDTKIQLPLPKSTVTNDTSSLDSTTPTKLITTASSSKAIKLSKEKPGKKSRLSTPTTTRNVSQSPTKTWDNTSMSMPCGDQNTQKAKKRATSQGDGAVRDSKIDKNPLKYHSDDEPQKSMDDESEQKLSKKVRFEEFLKEDNGATTSENNSSLLEVTKDDVSSNYFTPSQSPKMSPKINPVTSQDSNASFAEQVNRIIKRVEDIYSQLDDMHNSSSEDEVKKFKDETKDVHSEMFLTPFMQAVKEKRKVPEKTPQKSPSYYNVINFLDSLKDMQDEKPIETHTARLCYHVNVYHQPMVYNQAQIEHTADILPVIPIIQSPIKNVEEDTKIKQKKVHFLVPKEDKSSQATICDFHKAKILRISSQQFPPSDDELQQLVLESQTPVEICKDKDIFFDSENLQEKDRCEESDVINISRCNKISHPEIKENLDVSVDKVPNSDGISKFDYGYDWANELKIINMEFSDDAENELLCETCRNSDFSEVNEKPVQVYCHVEYTESTTNEAITCTSREVCEKQTNIHVSQSDKSNQSICLMHKDNNTDESIKALTDAIYNERGVNTEEMETSQSMQNCSNETSLVSLIYDGSHEIVFPKVVKEKIDIRDGNYGENSILHIKNSLQKLNQNKIVVFREVPSEVPNLLKSAKNLNLPPTKLNRKKTDKRKDLRVMRKSSTHSINQIHKDTTSWGEKVVLLKSFYAIVYILMFTALSMDYRCM